MFCFGFRSNRTRGQRSTTITVTSAVNFARPEIADISPLSGQRDGETRCPQPRRTEPCPHDHRSTAYVAGVGCTRIPPFVMPIAAFPPDEIGGRPPYLTNRGSRLRRSSLNAWDLVVIPLQTIGTFFGGTGDFIGAKEPEPCRCPQSSYERRGARCCHSRARSLVSKRRYLGSERHRACSNSPRGRPFGQHFATVTG